MGHHQHRGIALSGIALNGMALNQIVNELACLRLKFSKRFVSLAIATLQFEFQRLAFPHAVGLWMAFG